MCGSTGEHQKEMMEIANTFDTSDFQTKHPQRNQYWGLDKGEVLVNWINERIKQKTGIENCTFQQLHDHTGKSLEVYVTNLNRNQVECFSHKTMPDFSVAKACQISMSLPFLFTPTTLNNDTYVDGGIDEYTCKRCRRYPKASSSEFTGGTRVR